MNFKKGFLIGILICSAVFASAYDAVGHRIVADIAYHNLSKKAKKQCDKLLGKHGIVYEATWADEIKSDKAYDYAYQWHYQNLKDNLSSADLKHLLDNPAAEGEHLFFALNMMKERLRKNRNDAEALKFIVHFMGDLHQPLHLGRLDDLGGNKVTINWFGKQTNIHAVWDGQIIDSKRMSYTEFSAYLRDKFDPQKPEFKKLSLLNSVEKSYALRTAVYSYDYSDTNNYHYVYRFADEQDEMLYLGGIQLAHFLNTIFK